MIKNYLLLSVMGMAFLAFTTTPAMAEDSIETPAEALVDLTEDMSNEATEEFEQDVDCVENAMDGEETTTDCISKEEEIIDDSEMEITE